LAFIEVNLIKWSPYSCEEISNGILQLDRRLKMSPICKIDLEEASEGKMTELE